MVHAQPGSIDAISPPIGSLRVRRVTVLDLLILIAAIALGLALIGTEAYAYPVLQFDYYTTNQSSITFRLVFWMVSLYAAPTVYFLTCAVVVLAVISRRDERVDRLRQTGVSGCLLVMLTTLLLAFLEPVRDSFYFPLSALLKTRWHLAVHRDRGNGETRRAVRCLVLDLPGVGWCGEETVGLD